MNGFVKPYMFAYLQYIVLLASRLESLAVSTFVAGMRGFNGCAAIP